MEASEPGREIFPIDDVEACLAAEDLCRHNAPENLHEIEREALGRKKREAVARGVPESAEWLYFTSPAWTWENLCGREGWLLYDAATKTQYDFVMTVMN